MTATFRRPGIVSTDHVLPVPLDHARPDGEQIEVYARVVVAADQADADLPYLLYLQGGPGGKSPRPDGGAAWLKRALTQFRVVLLDQRGTGRSTPVTRHTLTRRGSAAEQAAYLTHFRADSIVADAELLRTHLAGGERWSVLGQSFGGFCAVRYLCAAPEGLREVLVTGGLPSLDATADEVYRAAYPRMAARNEAFRQRFPDSVPRALAVMEVLRAGDVVLPSGILLTPQRFQSVGITLGMAATADRLNYLLEEAFVAGVEGPELSDTFLAGVDDVVSQASGPLYALLHESIYAQGPATRWAAERVRAEFPAFDPERRDQVLLTGETFHPWHFEGDPFLEPLRGAADLLAAKDDWPPLYDRAVLAANEVPVAAIVYHDDLYVEREHSLATAAAIRGARVWITNEYEHDGVSVDERVFDRLLAMARGMA